tara:strand:+ start:185 stop:745 length:561 start_codon:yes stop_codon:yes gene_type:complete
MKKLVVFEGRNWHFLPQDTSGRLSYVWDWFDWFAVFVSVISLGFLIYLTQIANNIVQCGDEVQDTSSFTGIQVYVLNRRCEEHTELFVCVITAAASFQYVRALLGNEVGQERRVILNQSVSYRPWSERWSYHWKSVVMSILGIFGTVLIITQNVWVFLTLTLSYELAMYRYLKRSPADSERAQVVK